MKDTNEVFRETFTTSDLKLLRRLCEGKLTTLSDAEDEQQWKKVYEKWLQMSDSDAISLFPDIILPVR